MSMEVVLNQHPQDRSSFYRTISVPEGQENIRKLLTALKDALTELKAKHEDFNGCINYTSLKKSKEYENMKNITYNLAYVKPNDMSENDKKAFLINVYNCLTLHAILECGNMKSSVLDVNHFWDKYAYNIGDLVITLNELEHGLLRANSPHPSSQEPFLKVGNPKLKYALNVKDPRVHFALNCGSKSCPLLRVYSGDKIDEQLDMAARAFCNQEINYSISGKIISVSKIFQWYKDDFPGTNLETIRWASRFLKNDAREGVQDLLTEMEDCGRVKIIYHEYNWSLNATS